jgi:hypothetical protein
LTWVNQGIVGSACSLLIFLLVGVAGYRVRSETGTLGLVVLLGIAATAVVLIFFAVDTLRNAPQTFVAIVAIAALAVVLDLVWKRLRGSGQTPEELAVTSPAASAASMDRTGPGELRS